MELYIRVIANTEVDVIREVRVNASLSLMEFHQKLFPVFGLEPGEMASFYRSNANWDQGEEIPMMSMNDQNPVDMTTVDLANFFAEEKQGLYVYSFLHMNIFYLECFRTQEEDGFESFVVEGSVGELPAKEVDDTIAQQDPSNMSPEELDKLYGLDALDEDPLNQGGSEEDDFDPYADEYR